MSYVDNPELLARRDKSVWTPIAMWLAIVQFFAYIVGFYLLMRFLVVGDCYLAATISVWVKIVLMWAVTATPRCPRRC